MQTSHTPGPWIRIARANGKLGETICFTGTDELTATDICRVDPEDDNGAAIRVADANARLIAAAPDLANATRDLLKAFRECIGSAAFWEFEQSNPAVRDAQRALANAGL